MGLQGWDASYHFASHIRERNPIGFSSQLDDPRLWNVDVPNQIGIYPAISRMVFRGDVQQGPLVAERRINIEQLVTAPPAWLDQETSSVSSGLGDFKQEGTALPLQTLALGRVGVRFVDQPQPNLMPEIQQLEQQKALTSATGQLHWDWSQSQQGWIRINTKGTQGVTGFLPAEPLALDAVTLTGQPQFASIWLTAPEPEEALDSCEAALLSVVARVRNTGMAFSEDDTQLVELGSAPMLCEPTQATLQFKRKPKSIEILDHDGLPTGRYAEGLEGHRFHMDTGRDKTLYYWINF